MFSGCVTIFVAESTLMIIRSFRGDWVTEAEAPKRSEMWLWVANHITNNGGTEYHKTCRLYEYMSSTSMVDLI